MAKMGPTTTFKQYLATRYITNTPRGDFICDVRRDKKFPDAQSWNEIETYLSWHAGMNRDAVLAEAVPLFRQYMRMMNDHRPPYDKPHRALSARESSL